MKMAVALRYGKTRFIVISITETSLKLQFNLYLE